MPDKHTMQLGDKYRALEVEWETQRGFERPPDGSLKPIDRHLVSIISSQSTLFDHRRIIGLNPRTALNLLTWLETEKPLLESLAKKEVQ
jgi:hypothetical protein